MGCGTRIMARCILSRSGVYIIGAVLTTWSIVTCVGAVLLTFSVFYGKLVEDIAETGYGRHYWRSVKAYTVTMEVLSIITFMQFTTCIILLYAMFKEKIPTIHTCTGIYAILTSLAINVPMMEAILCFHNAMYDNWMLAAGGFILFLGFLHTGLAAVFTVNLRFHYKEDNEDCLPFVNEESIAVEDVPQENAVVMSVTDPITPNW